MIQLNDISFSYDHKSIILDHVNFTFKPQNHYVIKGDNGSGKTTLVKLLLGLALPTSGHIDRRVGVTTSYLPDNNGIYEYLTIMQNIQFRLGIYDIPFKTQKGYVESLLELFDITQYKNVVVSMLSMGTKKKVAIICALVVRADILILDEPTIGLDGISRKILLDFVLNKLPINSLLICITHDEDWLLNNSFNTISVRDSGVHQCSST